MRKFSQNFQLIDEFENQINKLVNSYLAFFYFLRFFTMLFCFEFHLTQGAKRSKVVVLLAMNNVLEWNLEKLMKKYSHRHNFASGDLFADKSTME